MKAYQLILIPFLLLFAGCSMFSPATAANPPSKFDESIWSIKTNVVTVTNIVPQIISVTNNVTETNVVTQTNGVTITNIATVPTVIVLTNYVPTPMLQTNYVYDQGAGVGALTTGVSALGPWGAVAGAVLAGFFGIWGKMKSTQADTAQTVAQTSLQAIATAKAVIAAMPNGSQYVTQFNTWLAQHQNDADVASEVASIVDEFVNPYAANGAAAAIIGSALIPITPTPTPVTPTTGKSLLSS